jgi:hypothetical protein
VFSTGFLAGVSLVAEGVVVPREEPLAEWEVEEIELLL